MTYEEVNPTIFKFQDDGDLIEGFLLRAQSDIGTNKSKIYSIETSEGVKNVWGSAMLDERMALVKIGDKIRITFKGLAKDSKKGKNPAKIFKVEIDKD